MASSPASADTYAGELQSETLARFDEPWAAAFAPGTTALFVTEQGGTMKFIDVATGRIGTVTGIPTVDYGGQGGLGDIAFLQSEADSSLGSRTIYLTWAEAGEGDTRGAALGRGTLTCGEADSCRVKGLRVIWRQTPKVTGRGHYSHRIAFSPDERYLFLASGDRQKEEPSQDLSNNLGAVLRLNLDGSPAPGNPFASRGSPSDEIWTWGNRNILGLAFDGEGRLWAAEHGPDGGDEINLIERGQNYGWPRVSDGDHYDGKPIPDNSPDDAFVDPLLGWTPSVAPGDIIIYDGGMFAGWGGDMVLANLRAQNLIRIEIGEDFAREAQTHSMGARIREIVEGPNGAIYVFEDGEDARLLRLTPER
jgi:glucose/arabinose dehydrogenase